MNIGSRRSGAKQPSSQRGAAGWGFLWLIGIPVPVLLALFLLRGCT
jgi:hypothetical protein